MEPIRRLLFWLLDGTKGGPTRLLLLSILIRKPMNMRRLALAAKLDYKTVEHHVRLMEKNSIIESTGGGYGRVFFVSELVLAQTVSAVGMASNATSALRTQFQRNGGQLIPGVRLTTPTGPDYVQIAAIVVILGGVGYVVYRKFLKGKWIFKPKAERK